MQRIYYFRHGESEFNRDTPHLIGGRSNFSPLTEQGQEQAKKLGLWIASHDIVPDVVYASPAVRTLQTARIALAEAGLLRDIVIDDDLQEMSQGIYEGKPRKGVYTTEVLNSIAQQQKGFKHQGGESVDEVAAREHSFSLRARSIERHQTIMAFTHGFFMRSGIGQRLGWTFEEIRANEIGNAAAVIQDFDEEGKMAAWQYNIDTQNP